MTTVGLKINNWMAVVDGQRGEISCFCCFSPVMRKQTVPTNVTSLCLFGMCGGKLLVFFAPPTQNADWWWLRRVMRPFSSLPHPSTSIQHFNPTSSTFHAPKQTGHQWREPFPYLSIYFLYCMHEEKKNMTNRKSKRTQGTVCLQQNLAKSNLAWDIALCNHRQKNRRHRIEYQQQETQ